jgi:hypothetical protein
MGWFKLAWSGFANGLARAMQQKIGNAKYIGARAYLPAVGKTPKSH